MKNITPVVGIIVYTASIGAAMIGSLCGDYAFAAFAMTVAIWIRVTHKQLFD